MRQNRPENIWRRSRIPLWITAGDVADGAKEMVSDAAEFVQKTYKKATDKEKDLF